MEMFCGLDCGNLQVSDTHTAPRNCLRVPYGDVSNINQQLNKFTSRDLAKNYIARSISSKDVIAKHIGRSIRTNVSVLAIHPLFQRLWVTVCMDRTGSRTKRTLKKSFKARVLQISDAEDKRQAQAWLDGADTFLHEIDEEIQMPAEVNLGDNIPPEGTKCCDYCFEENSILKSMCTNPSCVIKMCTECANDWSNEAIRLCIYCNSPLIYSDMPTN
ncbi:hypothetical protein FNYG_03941 [Fusarium nygamai]|uniref:Uncharacterized protein n=1 Tax=Gibberella nygamai TaxID=42673 RepID=A0A2K0WKA3_GIBNY|nr:hypothetical protein FNYG_03941 [Fusarium nygamai]